MLRDLNISVNKGQLFCVLGGNGVGKSTILNKVVSPLLASKGKVENENGVKYIMLAVSSYEDSFRSLELSRNFDFMYCAAGIHPECVDTAEGDYIEKRRISCN